MRPAPSVRVTEKLRSDGRVELVTALSIAAGHLRGAHPVPEVTIFFSNNVLLRGNRAVKVHADSYQGFAHRPTIHRWRPPASRSTSTRDSRGAPAPDLSGAVAESAMPLTGLRLYPGIDGHVLAAVLDRPGLRGVVVEAYGSGGSGPPDAWFLEPLRTAVDTGVTVVVITQCRAGSVSGGLYATGSVLLATGAIPGGDMTFKQLRSPN